MNLLELPDCMLDKVFEYLSYDEISKKRLVSTKINKICQSLLNRSFLKVQSRIDKKIEKLRPLLPRKESQRWNHPAYLKISCLETIGVNLRVLWYTYDDYIKNDLCCFIPGKVIDMSLYVMNTYPQYRSLDANCIALKDAICMAKEHFRDNIEPTLRKLKDKKTKELDMSWLFGRTEHTFINTRINEPTFKPNNFNQATLTRNLNNGNDVPFTQNEFLILKSAASKPPVPTPMDTQQNLKQFQNHAACQNAALMRPLPTPINTQPNLKTSQDHVDCQKTAPKPPVSTPMDAQQNSRKCQDHADCQKAYLRLNRKYDAVLSQVRLTNKKYNDLLRKVNLGSQAIKKQSNSQKEVADLRRRLEKFESQNPTANGESDASYLVPKTNLKKILRSSKRLADDGGSHSRSSKGKGKSHIVEKADVKNTPRSSKRLARRKNFIN